MSSSLHNPRILFVDDEPNVLDGLRRQLRTLYDVRTATGGAAGLIVLESEEPFVAVVSDMQMPGMNGAAFLREVRLRAPDAVRLLLTGHADVDAAMEAVNEGHIFRFLRKPCPPNVIQLALAGAVEHHRLITAEKELLERTLRGSIEALSETLALASPAAFGASMRIRRTVGEIAKAMHLPNVWELEIAATMAQLGVVTLPHTLVERIAAGKPLDPEERALVLQLPGIADRLLAKIPRLEGVREMVRAQHAFFGGGGVPAELAGNAIPIGARVLKAATDLDAFESAGMSATDALAKMRDAFPKPYDPAVMTA